MLFRCSHCSFALLIDDRLVFAAVEKTNALEDFRRGVDTLHKTGEPHANFARCCPGRQCCRLHPLVNGPPFEQRLPRLWGG